MSETTGKSSDSLRAVTDPPVAIIPNDKMIIDAGELLKVWAEQSEAMHIVAEGHDRLLKAMRQTQDDNELTRSFSQKTRYIVLGSCAMTVLSSVLSAWWTVSYGTQG